MLLLLDDCIMQVVDANIGVAQSHAVKPPFLLVAPVPPIAAPLSSSATQKLEMSLSFSQLL